jgi:hypothetical protein
MFTLWEGALSLQGYCDTPMSTSGYIFTTAAGAVSWCSKLQKIVAMSTTEAEYISATEAIWLNRLAEDLGMSVSTPVLRCHSHSVSNTLMCEITLSNTCWRMV